MVIALALTGVALFMATGLLAMSVTMGRIGRILTQAENDKR